jgi:hypothetical protein
MTDAVTTEVVLDKPADAPIEPTPVEQDARTQGWVPKEDFTGDEALWIDAAEFVRRRPLFDKIDRQNRELKEVRKTLDQLAAHHAQVRELEYKRALADLKTQKATAFEEGDASRIVEIDDQIDAVKEQQKAHKVEQAQAVQREAAQVHPEFEAWTNRNTWYESNPIMKAAADTIGRDLAGKMDRAEVLKEVEKRIRQEFPHKFTNPNREKPGAVESTSPKGKKSDVDYSPSDFERQVAKRFVRQGVFKNEDEYYKQLKQLNGKS